MYGIETNNVSRSEEPDSEVIMEDEEEAKQTPIKSWLRKHMNSEKSPEREDSPPPAAKTSSNLPQYIIPLVGNQCYNHDIFFQNFPISGARGENL